MIDIQTTKYINFLWQSYKKILEILSNLFENKYLLISLRSEINTIKNLGIYFCFSKKVVSLH